MIAEVWEVDAMIQTELEELFTALEFERLVIDGDGCHIGVVLLHSGVFQNSARRDQGGTTLCFKFVAEAIYGVTNRPRGSVCQRTNRSSFHL